MEEARQEQEKRTRSILCVVGARPNFMKMAPILRALEASPHGLVPILLHTGQHYDAAMKAAFFDQLGIPEPGIDLEVGSGTHSQQTAEVMRRFEPVVDSLKPSAVLVVGDVNSTIACALVAVKTGVPVIHVESGLRSRDRSMPEEINRVLTDQISDLLFTTERSARDNLLQEGIEEHRIRFVGNVMIDSLRYNLDKAVPTEDILARQSIRRDVVDGGYGVLTLHRPSNVDDRSILERLLVDMQAIATRIPLVFPVHPRTKKQIERFGLQHILDSPGMICLPPQGYLEMLGLMSGARLVLTDSGGIQEETTAIGVPCVTLRENTERPITVVEGTNTVAGTDSRVIRQSVADILETGGKRGRIPEYWDGHAAERIAAAIAEWLASRDLPDAVSAER